MTIDSDIFISNKQKSLPSLNCLVCSSVVLHRVSFRVPLLLWLSYGMLKWISSAFEEGSKAMQKYTQLTTGTLAHEAGLGTPWI